MGKLRIVYVHGIHGKPPEEIYRAEWDAALQRLGYVRDIESTMMYWSDIRLGLTPAEVAAAHAEARKRREHRFGRLRPQTNSPLGYAISLALHAFDPAIRRITKQLLTEVYLYFYGRSDAQDIRDAILGRMDAMMREVRPQVIIAHSWGSVIAYDYLLNRGYDGELDALISLGLRWARTTCRNDSDDGVSVAGAALAQRLRCDGPGDVARPPDLERSARPARGAPDPRRRDPERLRRGWQARPAFVVRVPDLGAGPG